MRVRLIAIMVPITLWAVLLPTVSASAATPQRITCGMHLSGDGYLAKDLRCPVSDGIILDRGATIDLRGHRLIGVGTSNLRSVGITLPPEGATTVKHGRIEGWSASISSAIPAEGSVSLTVSRVTFVDGGAFAFNTGFAITYSVADSTFVRSGVGGYGVSVTVRRSTFRGNGQGVDVNAGWIDVSQSTFSKNDVAISCTESSCRVTSSKIADGRYGVFAAMATVTLRGNQFSGNDIAYNGNGATSFLPDQPYADLVSGNHFTDNDVAFSLSDSTSVAVRNNVFRGNREAFTGESADTQEYSVLLDHNLFVRNTDGVNLPAPATPGAKLKANRAFNNTGWGIYAPSATDLGGNLAHGNGNQPQCVGVTCSES